MCFWFFNSYGIKLYYLQKFSFPLSPATFIPLTYAYFFSPFTLLGTKDNGIIPILRGSLPRWRGIGGGLFLFSSIQPSSLILTPFISVKTSSSVNLKNLNPTDSKTFCRLSSFNATSSYVCVIPSTSNQLQLFAHEISNIIHDRSLSSELKPF